MAAARAGRRRIRWRFACAAAVRRRLGWRRRECSLEAWASAARWGLLPRLGGGVDAGGRRGGGGVRAWASRFEPRSSYISRLALAAAASARGGCWLVGGGAGSARAGGG